VADDQGIENLKQVARYVIMHSTFMHSWANNQQQDDGGEVKYASLGIRWGDSGVFVSENNESIAPHPKIASEQIWISTFLSKTKFGFIMRNEDEDIHPLFLETLREFKDEFDAIGLNIDELQSRTNI
jgi:histone deacetylase complex regulatory component SIN3